MLLPAAPSDLQFFHSLYMHPEINPFLLYDPMLISEFESIYNDLLQKSVLYKYSSERKDIGMCKLVPQYHRNAHIVYLGGVAVDPSYGGKGHGLKMLQEIISLTEDRGFKRIELSTANFNEKAIRLYEKAGFVREGILRNYTWMKAENRFFDEVLMSRIS
jgi:RimJ/RimL family protein N-acetyltransferase